jgi:hypothetical protein
MMIMPFDIPKRASRKPVKVTMHDKSTAEIVFLGKGFLKLWVDVYRLAKGESWDLSDIVRFSMIYRGRESSMRQKEAYQKARQPSPRESMAASMGGWDDYSMSDQ